MKKHHLNSVSLFELSDSIDLVSMVVTLKQTDFKLMLHYPCRNHKSGIHNPLASATGPNNVLLQPQNIQERSKQ